MAITTVEVPLAITTVYTSSGTSVITFLSLCNHTSTDIPVYVYVVPNGSFADTNTLVYSGLVIPAGDTYQIYVGNEKLILSDGDSVQAYADTDLLGITAVTSYMVL